MKPIDELMTADEVAENLRVHWTTHRLLKPKELRASRLARISGCAASTQFVLFG